MVEFTEETVRLLSAAFRAKDSQNFHDIMKRTLSPMYAKHYPKGKTFDWKAVACGSHTVIPFNLLLLTLQMDEYELMDLFMENYGASRFLDSYQKHRLLQGALDLRRGPKWITLLEGFIFPKDHSKQYVMTTIQNDDLDALKVLLEADCYWDVDCDAKARELGRQDFLDYIAKRQKEQKPWCGYRGCRGYSGRYADPFLEENRTWNP